MDQKSEQSTSLGKKELILEAAARVFSRNGFHRATVEEIAQRAGVGKGTIYEYFPSKKELFQQLIIGRVEDLISELQIQLAEGKTAKDKMEIVIKKGLNHFDSLEHLNRIMMTETTNVEDIKMRQLLVEKREALIDLIIGIIDEGISWGEFRPVDRNLAALLFLGSVSEIIASTLISSSLEKPKSSTVLDLILKGLSA